jgi:pilus assembly protein CpaC
MAAAYATGAPRRRCPQRASAIIGTAVLVVLVWTGDMRAQNLAANAAAGGRVTSAMGADTESTSVQLLVGRSTVLNVGMPITRLSLTSPDIADAMVTTPQQVLIHGKVPGTISMFVWDRSGGIKRYEVSVSRDLSPLTHQLEQLFPGETIAVHSNGKDVVIAGTVSSKYVIDKAAEVAAGYVEKKDDVVNLLKQQEGVASNQVLLRVRFAEVSRSALTELGSSFFTQSDGYKDWVARTSTQQFAAPDFDTDQGGLVFSDFLNLFVFNTKYNMGTVIKALQTKGLFQSLAEPNLIAENGKEASFLAGGEYPYPVAQGQGGNLSVTIVFKEFGIRLRFTPVLMGGDLIHLKVMPEVSSLDFTNAVVANGFRVPALSTRRAETEVELRDGQTFAIAGLMNNTLTSTMQKIPGIGDIPILGNLFKSKAAQKAQSELVVMITPTIVRAGQPGAAPGLPGLIQPYLGKPNKTLPPPGPWQGSTSTRSENAQPAATPAQNATVPKPVFPAPVTPSPAAETVPTVTVAPTPAATAPAQQTQPAAVQPAPVQPPQPQSVVPNPQGVTPVPPPVATDNAASQRSKKQQEAAEKLTAEQLRQEKAHQKAEEKRMKEDARRAAEQERVDRARAAEEERRQARLAVEQAKKDAVAAKKAAEDAKKKEEEDRKRGKALAEAEAKLKAAQAEYEKVNKTGKTVKNDRQ